MGLPAASASLWFEGVLNQTLRIKVTLYNLARKSIFVFYVCGMTGTEIVNQYFSILFLEVWQKDRKRSGNNRPFAKYFQIVSFKIHYTALGTAD